MSQRNRFAISALSVVVAVAMLGAGAASTSERGGRTAARPARVVSPLALASWPTTPEVKRGRVVYERNCIGCHGDEGLGDGDAARWLDVPPRNFQRGKFKFRSTASGQLPLEDDVVRTVTCGLPGSAMPGFPLLTDRQRRDVVDYVLDLAVFNQAKVLLDVELAGGAPADQVLADLPLLRERAIATSLGARRRVIPPAYPAPTAESIERGRAYYLKVCAHCHGPEGRGDGSSSFALRDWQDAAIPARDFTSGTFRAGNKPEDLFLRIRTGLNGTPMPSSAEPDDVIWSLIHYLRSVQTPGRIPVTRRMGCDGGS
jgi:cytochrome c oxidase cbb3-type subunit 2